MRTDARGRVFREWPTFGPNAWKCMPWTWQCHTDHSEDGYFNGPSPSGIAAYQWVAMKAMNEHLEAHRG